MNKQVAESLVSKRKTRMRMAVGERPPWMWTHFLVDQGGDGRVEGAGLDIRPDVDFRLLLRGCAKEVDALRSVLVANVAANRSGFWKITTDACDSCEHM